MLDKGIGAELPFLGLVIMALAFGSMTFPIQSFFSSELDTTINDLNRVSTAQTSAELYFYNYVPTAAVYSTYQTSYDLAREGGGPNIDWDSDTFKSASSSGYGGPVYVIPGSNCNSLLDQIECNLEDNATEYLQENYMSQSKSGRCTRPEYSLATYFQQDGTTLTGYTYAFDPIQTTCSFPDGEVSYRAPNSFLSQEFNVPGNRFITLAEEANRTLHGVYNNWKSDVDEYYVSTETTCGTKDYSAAEQKAVNDAEEDIQDAFDNAPSSSIHSDVAFETKEITGPSTTFSEGESTDKFEGADSQSYSDVGDCNCHYDHDHDDDNNTEQHCLDDEYEAKVNITVEKSNAELIIKDEFSKVPVDSGKRYMNFRVEEYSHDFHDD